MGSPFEAPIGTPHQLLDDPVRRPCLQRGRHPVDISPVSTVSGPALSAAASRPAGVTGEEAVAPRPVIVVTEGQVLAARVIAAEGGRIELAVAGGRVLAQTELALTVGQTVQLEVTEAAGNHVTLRVVPTAAEAVPEMTVASPGMKLPLGVAQVLAAALDGAEITVAAQLPAGAATAAAEAPETVLARAAIAAGVQTPAQAVAFTRLAAAGLPTTPAAVAGFAQLTEGLPLGRAIATLLDAMAPRPAVVTADPKAAALPLPTGAPAPLPNGTIAPAPVVVTTPVAVPSEVDGLPHSAAAPVGAGTVPVPVPTSAPALLDAIRVLTARIAGLAVDADPVALRKAIAEMGHGLERKLANGSQRTEEPSLRTLLVALAAAEDASPQVATAALRTADALAAQNLAPPALTAQTEPSNMGAYLQIPLPGGQTAEVRINPDGQGEGGGGATGPRKLAFLLHMTSLGALMIEATVGPRGVDATVKAQSTGARAFLKTQMGELEEALERAHPGAVRVGLERLREAAPRLVPPPPSSALDLQA
jgi:hypothetical protein